MPQFTNERRQRERITLRCAVEVFVQGGDEVRHATTLNLSSRGLYCISEWSFSPGERLRCRIELTPRRRQSDHEAVFLDCLVEVVRVERTADAYGIGCRIVRYLLTRAAEEVFAKTTARSDMPVGV
jgi:hypothetical protein